MSAAVQWRVWLASGRYVLVSARDEREAMRKLTRTQRKNATRAVMVIKSGGAS